jgi:hypothetical protein
MVFLVLSVAVAVIEVVEVAWEFAAVKMILAI